jgi:hypothetical protein
MKWLFVFCPARINAPKWPSANFQNLIIFREIVCGLAGATKLIGEESPPFLKVPINHFRRFFQFNRLSGRLTLVGKLQNKARVI